MVISGSAGLIACHYRGRAAAERIGIGTPPTRRPCPPHPEGPRMTSSARDVRLSTRVGAIAESATLAVDAKAKALKAKGEDVIGFGVEGEEDQHLFRSGLPRGGGAAEQSGKEQAPGHFPAPQNTALRNNCTKWGLSKSPPWWPMKI